MNTRIVILAGGKSTRMNDGVPKVLKVVRGKPMIEHLLTAVSASGVDPHPVIVVGHKADEVKAALGDTYTYVLQKEQRGTGDAVQCTEKLLRGNAEAIIVLYGDHPGMSAETISRLADLHAHSGAVLTMMTVKLENFEEWRAVFKGFGRVVRNAEGAIEKIIEKKDATPAELAITEVNPSFFCFSADWLWDHLKNLSPQNVAGEYYLTDLVHMAMNEGVNIASADVDPRESIGVNTPEELACAEKIANENHENSE